MTQIINEYVREGRQIIVVYTLNPGQSQGTITRVGSVERVVVRRRLAITSTVASRIRYGSFPCIKFKGAWHRVSARASWEEYPSITLDPPAEVK